MTKEAIEFARVVTVHYRYMAGMGRAGLKGDFYAWSKDIHGDAYLIAAGKDLAELSENIRKGLTAIFKEMGKDYIAAPIDDHKGDGVRSSEFCAMARWALFPRKTAKEQLNRISEVAYAE